MEVKYLNLKSIWGTETVDEVRQEEFKTYREYVKEYKRLLCCYRECGQSVYLSQRACKDWCE